MRRTEMLMIRMSDKEREVLRLLADKERRNESDMVRQVIRRVAEANGVPWPQHTQRQEVVTSGN